MFLYIHIVYDGDSGEICDRSKKNKKNMVFIFCHNVCNAHLNDLHATVFH